MKRVYKYPLRVSDEQNLVLPAGAQILSVGQQDNDMFLWALVDPTQTRVDSHLIRIAGTGHNIEYDGVLLFLGTVHIHHGSLVFHVFELVNSLAGV